MTGEPPAGVLGGPCKSCRSVGISMLLYALLDCLPWRWRCVGCPPHVLTGLLPPHPSASFVLIVICFVGLSSLEVRDPTLYALLDCLPWRCATQPYMLCWIVFLGGARPNPMRDPTHSLTPQFLSLYLSLTRSPHFRPLGSDFLRDGMVGRPTPRDTIPTKVGTQAVGFLHRQPSPAASLLQPTRARSCAAKGAHSHTRRTSGTSRGSRRRGNSVH